MIYGLDLMVFVVKDCDMDSLEIGLDIPLEDCELRPYTFYNVDYITADRTNPDHTLIGSCCDEFICNEKVSVVKRKIEQLRILRFN